MGDTFQTIVDREASITDAEHTASEIVGWLVKLGIVNPSPTDCVLSTKRKGYRPGPNYRNVVAVRDEHDDHTLGLRVNGLEVVLGRTVFDAGQYGLGLVCRKCGSHIDGGDAWSDAVGEWHEGGGGYFACPKCGYAESVSEWSYDPAWGFGNLGFQFWNWPPFKPSFVTEFTQRLGHQTVLVRGKT